MLNCLLFGIVVVSWQGKAILMPKVILAYITTKGVYVYVRAKVLLALNIKMAMSLSLQSRKDGRFAFFKSSVHELLVSQ